MNNGEIIHDENHHYFLTSVHIFVLGFFGGILHDSGPLDRDTGDQPQPLDLGKAVYVMLTVNVRENVSLLTFWKDDLND